MKKLLTLFLSVGLLFGLAACKHAPILYTVTYESDYGTAPDPIEVEENTILTAEQLAPLTADG